MRERIVIISVSIVVAIALIVGLVAYWAWYTLFRMVPGPFDGPDVSDADYFKYGTIGIEPTAGVPYWIWVVLPEVFPERLPGPGGYASLGAVWKEGQETPYWFPQARDWHCPSGGHQLCRLPYQRLPEKRRGDEANHCLGGRIPGL